MVMVQRVLELLMLCSVAGFSSDTQRTQALAFQRWSIVRKLKITMSPQQQYYCSLDGLHVLL